LEAGTAVTVDEEMGIVMNKIFNLLGGAIVLAAGGYFGSIFVTSKAVKAQVSEWKRTRPFKEFTVELTTSSLRNGQADLHRREIFAMRGDGAFVTQRLTGDLHQTRAIDFSDGTKVVIYENMGLKSTVRDFLKYQSWARSNEQVAQAKCLHPTHTHLQLIGEGTLLGFRGLLVRDTAVPVNMRKSLELVTPELDCFTIRHEGATEDGSFVKEASAIRLGTPDTSLFTVPANLIEVNPMEAAMRLASALGVECETCLSQPANVRREDYYRKHRP